MLDGTNFFEELRAQTGPQETFLSVRADIAIYGGAAGGGKTYALLLEAARNIDNPEYGGVIFRRDAVQITNQGGLWDTSQKIYSKLDGIPRQSPYREWHFPSGATIGFNHLHNEYDVNSWQGSQIPFIGYDELTHFVESQFWYMLSRNRSMSGVRPYIRATCNPDSDSWVAELISWWIDQDTGFPILERSGIVRYFVRVEEKLYWGATRQELAKDFPSIEAKSLTFVPATLNDNKVLLQIDPSYGANLQALGRVEKARLLDGNWKIKPQSGSYFPSMLVQNITAVPTDVKQWVRRWDLAATDPSEVNPSPDSTASVLMGKRENGRIVVADGINIKRNANTVREIMRNVATQDKQQYGKVTTVVPQDPGQAGKEQASSLIAHLYGFYAKAVRETGPKITRAEPLSAQWQAGNVDIVSGDWNKEYLREMENFPSSYHDDYVDASSGAYLECSSKASNYSMWRALGS